MNTLLIGNNYIAIEKSINSKNEDTTSLVGTLLSNMAYYGFIPSKSAYDVLISLSKNDLIKFWKEVEPSFKEVTGDNRNMDKFVVYKNFPKEVLDMSESQYWIAQILMYWGVPNEVFTEEKKDRPLLSEKKNLKVLALADETTAGIIYNNLLKNTARWSDVQTQHAKLLLKEANIDSMDMSDFSFKENGIVLINEVLKAKKEALNNQKAGKPVPLVNEININISNATDVLRLASAMSEGDISLREKTKFKKFSRPERRFLLENLNKSNNLVEDISLRKEQFKKLFAQLHPGDYKCNNVIAAYNDLYHGEIKTFNSKVENKISTKDNTVLDLLQSRPGDFFRRFHKIYAVFNTEAINAFKEVLPKLKTIQLVKLDKYLSSINFRTKLMYPPKGNWGKVAVEDNKKVKIKNTDLKVLHTLISKEISSRLDEKFPQGINLDAKVENIKLQTNDQKLATYGRGTVFEIPEEMTFVRSASYWENQSYGNTWFDNGWNFFDANWSSIGSCCWNDNHRIKGAVFSGDPTNSKELKGRACQMIDLDLEKLEKQGIRYAVWNILAYSRIKFSDATDVLGTLQWGEKAQSGNLYEPSRAQMVFPLKADALTSYVAYVDVVERKLVYMDANLAANTSSAASNCHILSDKMPAYVEYLNSLPSVADLFKHGKAGTTPILYSDKDIELIKDSSAYIFKPENAKNDFIKIDLAEILDSEAVEIKLKAKMKK